MKTYKSLLVVAIVGVVVIPSKAADFVKRAPKNEKPIAMSECFSTCNDAECLRDCIANVEGPVGPRAAPQQSLDDCFDEGLSNITSCAAVILLRADDAKFDVHSAFWTCVQVASQVFDQCPFADRDLTVESETILRRISLGHLVNAAEDDYKLFLAGKLTAYRLNVAVPSDAGDKTPPPGRQAEDPENKPRTFQECAEDYANELQICINVCNGSTTCLDGCNSVALKRLEKCGGVGKTPTT